MTNKPLKLVYESVLNDGLVRERLFVFPAEATLKVIGKKGRAHPFKAQQLCHPVFGKTKIYADMEPVRIDTSKPAYDPKEKRKK